MRSLPGQSGLIFLLFCLQAMGLPTPMPLLRRVSPLDHPDWIFELKYDGFRALAVLRDGGAQLMSRNGHSFSSLTHLGKRIAAALPGVTDTVLDGEIVCVDS